MPPHLICSCPYLTSTSMYEPYLVAHQQNIPYLGYLHRQLSRIPSPMLPKLLPPDAGPNY